MAETSSVLLAVGAIGLLLGAGFAYALPVTDSLDRADQAQAQSHPSPQAQNEGRMTVNESESTHEGIQTTAPPFYASRVVELDGELTLERLPVTLVNVNGDVEVRTGEDDAWSLVVNMTGYGATPEDARQARDRMSLSRDVGEPGDRQLVAEVDHENEDTSEVLGVDGSRQEAGMKLLVPADVDLGMVLSSTNGDVAVADVQASQVSASSTNGEIDLDLTTSRLEADTTNGRIHADLEGTRSVHLGSTNGEIVATIAPSAGGSIQASTTNADVDLSVPESDDHGYQVAAGTTNGHATIGLEDGETETSEDGTQATFRTHGFEQRAIQTSVQTSSTNGDVHVGPS